MNSHFIMQLKNDTASNFTTENPILAQGEMVVESDTKRLKVGDGRTEYIDLPYIVGAVGSPGASFKYGAYTMSADQTSSLITGNNVHFDTVRGSLPLPVNGVITLAANKTYKIEFSFYGMYSTANGCSNIQMHNITDSVYFGPQACSIPVTNGNNACVSPSLVTFITPQSNIDIEVGIVFSRDMTAIYKDCAYLVIEEYGGY